MIFETHAHYDDEAFDADREELLTSFPDRGIRWVINVGASIKTTKASLALAERYDHVYAAVGVHPEDITDLNEESFAWLTQQTRLPKVVAVGETGLDYYWEKEEKMREIQRYWFRRQLMLAEESGLPVIVHSREAAADTMELIQEAVRNSPQKDSDRRGVIHCYSYSPKQAEEYVKMGYYIGIGGVVTFQNARKLKETAEQIPLERILLETDSPYLAPKPFRGKRNDSGYLPYVAEQIAQLKRTTADEVERVTWENAMHLFPKVKEIHANRDSSGVSAQ